MPKSGCSQLTENQVATLLTLHEFSRTSIKKRSPVTKVLLRKKMIKKNQKLASDTPNYVYYTVTAKGRKVANQCYRTGKWGKSPARKEAERDVERMVTQARIGHIVGNWRKR